MKDGQLLRKIKISVLLIQHHCIVVDMLCTIEMSGLRKKSSKLYTLVCMCMSSVCMILKDWIYVNEQIYISLFSSKSQKNVFRY